MVIVSHIFCPDLFCRMASSRDERALGDVRLEAHIALAIKKSLVPVVVPVPVVLEVDSESESVIIFEIEEGSTTSSLWRTDSDSDINIMD